VSVTHLLADAAPIIGGFMSSESPVLDTLADMTAASVDHNSLSPREYMLVRLAALIAMDAPPLSYFANAAAIEESGMTTEDIQGVMIAVAPVVGAPRVMSAGGHILRALGIAVAVADADLAAEVSQP
jgi:alkylhydroperoxidase/carboxymuconolactone decarboxylase family protein YurZ